MSLKIASFNVNSIKMRLPNVLNWLDKNNTDVILMQETKTIDDNFPSLDSSSSSASGFSSAVVGIVEGYA